MKCFAFIAVVALALVACQGPVAPEGPRVLPGSGGVEGPEGPPENPDPLLPTGSTLRGSYALGFDASASSQTSSTSWSYGFTLASRPQAHFIAQGAAIPAECPGTGADPQADPGHLCVYEVDTNSNTTGKNVCSEGGCPTSGEWGAWVLAQSIGAGSVLSRGSWAVTALPAS